MRFYIFLFIFFPLGLFAQDAHEFFDTFDTKFLSSQSIKSTFTEEEYFYPLDEISQMVDSLECRIEHSVSASPHYEYEGAIYGKVDNTVYKEQGGKGILYIRTSLSLEPVSSGKYYDVIHIEICIYESKYEQYYISYTLRNTPSSTAPDFNDDLVYGDLSIVGTLEGAQSYYGDFVQTSIALHFFQFISFELSQCRRFCKWCDSAR